MISVIRNLFRVNLGIKKNERCLVFFDRPSPGEFMDSREEERRSRLPCVAFLAAEAGKSFAKEVILQEYASTGTHGAEPPPELWERTFGKRAVAAMDRRGIFSLLLKKNASEADMKLAGEIISRFREDAVDAVIALSNFSTSHTRFRDYLTRICLARYASMPLFEVSMLEGPMKIDWQHLAKITREVAARMHKAETVEIRTDNGTRISFSVKGRKALADTGILTKPGSFGNLPAGEAYIAPVEESANGKLVLDWAPTRELKTPVVLVIKNGYVEGVEGEEEFAAQLRKKLAERRENANIAELGIGTNNRARRPDNILESEKIMGTIHIALGDNSSFGGRVQTPFHQDFIFFRPTVVLTGKDGERVFLMKKGKIVTS